MAVSIVKVVERASSAPPLAFSQADNWGERQSDYEIKTRDGAAWEGAGEAAGGR